MFLTPVVENRSNRSHPFVLIPLTKLCVQSIPPQPSYKCNNSYIVWDNVTRNDQDGLNKWSVRDKGSRTPTRKGPYAAHNLLRYPTLTLTRRRSPSTRRRSRRSILSCNSAPILVQHWLVPRCDLNWCNRYLHQLLKQLYWPPFSCNSVTNNHSISCSVNYSYN